MGCGAPAIARQDLSITLTLPYCRIFLEIITLFEKFFWETDLRAYIYHGLIQANFEAPVGFETAKEAPGQIQGHKKSLLS